MDKAEWAISIGGTAALIFFLLFFASTAFEKPSQIIGEMKTIDNKTYQWNGVEWAPI
jgi:hypothetical protein